jgi:hypothetical protein
LGNAGRKQLVVVSGPHGPTCAARPLIKKHTLGCAPYRIPAPNQAAIAEMT